MPHNQKVENNSEESIGKNISVRMTEAQYQRLQRYMKLTRLKSTAYFCRIILGESLKGHSPKLKRAMHTSVNRIYSNVQQITRNQRVKDMDAETTQKLVFLMDRLCEEIYLLANQK
jgi:hypothetical protein